MKKAWREWSAKDQMASDRSDDASVFAQQKQCGSDLNLRKVVPKREMTMHFLAEKKTMMRMIRRKGPLFMLRIVLFRMVIELIM